MMCRGKLFYFEPFLIQSLKAVLSELPALLSK
jgi:hypothetical protein